MGYRGPTRAYPRRSTRLPRRGLARSSAAPPPLLLLVGLFIPLLTACGGSSWAPLERAEPDGSEAAYRLPVSIAGASGLTRRGDEYVAVTERDCALHFLRPAGDGFEVHTTTVSGWPQELEAEGLAHLSGDHFVVATEQSEASGVADSLLLVSLRGSEGPHVVAQYGVPYERFGVSPQDNHGLEGVCVAGERILVSLELSVAEDGQRYALLGRATLSADGITLPSAETAVQAWAPARVALQSRTGKLSGLSCRPAPGGGGDIEVHAIERHFGFARVLRFNVPASGEIPDIVPEAVVDLRAARPGRPAADGVPNYEGLIWVSDLPSGADSPDRGALALITDNYYRGRIDAPTELVFVRVPR